MGPHPANVEHALSSVRAYYDQWRTLTEAECAAIRDGQWTQVDRIQETKRNLQQFISGSTRELRQECTRSGLDPDMVEGQLHDLVNELIQLESTNGRALAEQMRAAREQQRQLDTSAHHLRQVRRVYTGTRSAHWESYS